MKERTLNEIKKYAKSYPILTSVFLEWLLKYADTKERDKKYKNVLLYNLNEEKDYSRAIVDFVAGMTDSFAIKVFNEIITF